MRAVGGLGTGEALIDQANVCTGNWVGRIGHGAMGCRNSALVDLYERDPDWPKLEAWIRKAEERSTRDLSIEPRLTYVALVQAPDETGVQPRYKTTKIPGGRSGVLDGFEQEQNNDEFDEYGETKIENAAELKAV